MEASNRQPTFWSNTQTYATAVICMILGTAVGFLLHSPEEARSSVPSASVSPQVAPSAMKGGMPSAQDMKRMADKQVAPLLAELQKHPGNAEVLAQVGRSYLAAQQYPKAQQYYEQSLTVKAAPDVMNELSFVYYTLGDVDKAIETLNRALKLDPKNSKYLFNLGMFEWHGKSDPKAAIAAWQGFLNANPKDPKRAEVEQMIARAKHHLTIPPGTKTDKPAL